MLQWYKWKRGLLKFKTIYDAIPMVVIKLCVLTVIIFQIQDIIIR